MENYIKPIIRITNDNADEFSEFYESLMAASSSFESKLLLNYPTVYIHSWKENDGMYSVYVGEANHIIDRTFNHYMSSRDENKWQANLLKKQALLYIIAHPHFNKSLTLDIENRMIEYMIACPTIVNSQNRRGNPQDSYYPEEEFESIFKDIWNTLRKKNPELFLEEEEIHKSALFKASPLRKLTDDQMVIKRNIISIVSKSINAKTSKHVLVFVEGSAGTGKTVLTSSTFCELCGLNRDEDDVRLKCRLLVNHNEQLGVYKQIVNRLGLDKEDSDIVSKPTHFINDIAPDNPVDVSFVDEAHLLLTQGKQAYQGNNQLKDIIDRSKVTIIMFDPMQVLTTEQYWEQAIINRFKETSIKSGTYYALDKQLRLNASDNVINWLSRLTTDLVIEDIRQDDTYDIKVFDTPDELEVAINEKASKKATQLSRIIASYDWPYSNKNKCNNGEYWGVRIGSWFKPWNYELDCTLSAVEKKKSKRLAWAERPHTINEVGSTFTIQGFDLNYAGVILGPSIKYENGRIVIHPECSENAKAIRNRTLSDNTSKNFATELLQHELNVLMTRGVNGLYIYAVDDALREALKKACNNG